MSDRTLQSWIYPKLTGDVGRDRNARTLQFACLLFSFAIGVVGVLETIIGDHVALPILAMPAGLVVAAVMNRAGRSAWAGRIAILTMLLGAILLVFEAHDGFRSHAMLLFPGLLLISVMLLDRVSYLTTAGIILWAVATLGIAEVHGLTRATPGIRTPTSYDSVFYIDLSLALFAMIGSRIAGDGQRNIFELRASIDRLSAANLALTQSAEALRRSEERFRQVAESAGEFIWEVDANGLYLYASPIVAQILGYTPEEIVEKMHFYDLFVPETREQVKAAAFEVFARREPFRAFPNWNVSKDGRIVALETSGLPILDGNGILLGYRGADTDVTERRRTEAELRESEQRFRSVADTAPVMIWISGMDKLCTFFNKPWLDFTGRTLEQELGNGWAESVHPEDLNRCLATYSSSFDARRNFQMEYRLRREDGQYRWVLDNGVPLYRGGEFAGYIGSCIDITDQKMAQDRLRNSERQLLEAQRITHVGGWERQFEGEGVYWSDEMFRIFGLPVGPPLHFQAFLSYVHPADREKVRQANRDALATSAPVVVEYRISRPDGETRFLRSVVEKVDHDPSTHALMAGAIQDITEQAKARQLLLDSQERLKTTQRLARVGNWEWDVKASTLLWSEETSRIFGQPPSYMPTYEAFLEAIVPQDRDRVKQAIGDCLAGAQTCSFEFQITRPNDDVRTVVCALEVVQDEAASPVRVTGAVHDITDRKRAENEKSRLAALVEEEHERLSTIVRSIPGAVWETRGSLENPARTVRFMSSRAEDMLGYAVEEWMTEPGLWPSIVHPEDRSRFVQDAIEIFGSDTGSGHHQYRCLTKGGKTVWLESHASTIRDKTGKPIGLCGVTIDISERKQAEAELLGAREELARLMRGISLGEMAASIAHEINQPLAAIVTNGSACFRFLAADAPNIERAKDILVTIIADGHRASEVIRRIRALFQQVVAPREAFDFNELIRETISVLHEFARSQNVIVRTDLEESLPTVFGDRTQLRQLLVNLVMNAIEATSKATHEPRLVVIMTTADAPQGIRLEVRDSGPGIPPEDRERIFHPFFTTKEAGMGLGLAISRTIVESHGGRILVDSNTPHGSRFLVALPNLP